MEKLCDEISLDDQVESVVTTLQQLLENDETNFKAIRGALASIQGDKYDHYVYPKTEDLAKGAKAALSGLMLFLPKNFVITIERCTIDALRKIYPEYLASIIDWKSAIDLVPNDPYALCLLCAKTNRHRIIITLSFFKMFAEKTKIDQRFRAARAMLVFLQLMRVSGNKSAPDEKAKRQVLGFFLMG